MDGKYRIPLTTAVAAILLALAIGGGTWYDAFAQNPHPSVPNLSDNPHTAYCGSGGIFVPATDYPPDSADKIAHCISPDLAPANTPGTYANPALLIWQDEAPSSLWYIWFDLSPAEIEAVQNDGLHIYTSTANGWVQCSTFTGYNPYDNTPTGRAYCVMPSFIGEGVTYAGLFWD